MKRALILCTLLCIIGFMPVTAEAKDKKIVIGVGQEKQLKKYIKWHSTNRKVVAVNKNGRIVGRRSGQAKIIAKTGCRRQSYKVTVVNYNGMKEKEEAIVRYASRYIGNRYVYGGTSLTKGTDCSGFTMSVYKKFGYKLPHNARRQMKSKNVKKVRGEIKHGDLIFYGKSKGKCSHVALYIGNQKVIHASTRRTGITISHYRYRRRVAVGRVLG